MPAEPRAELEKDLAEIRREVIESRNLVIKTDNLLKNLHAEVKAVGKRQEDSERKQWMSSAVAYVLFAGLCIGGSILFATAKGGAAKEERERLEKQVADLSQLTDRQKTDANASALASRQAADVYKMMTGLPGDERQKGVDALVKLDQSRLTLLEKEALTDRAAQLRKELGQAALDRGRAAFRKNDSQQAIVELGRFMAMNPSQEEGAEASFMLGSALVQARKFDRAVPLLAHYVSDKKAKTRDYAMLLLTQSYELAGQPDKAAETARDAIGSYPESTYVPQLKARLSAAKRMMADGGTDAAPQGAAPAPPAPKTAAPAPAQAPEAARAPVKPAGSPLPAQ